MSKPAPDPITPTLDEEDALALLTAGEMEITGRLVEASNTTLYATVSLDGVVSSCVYKPVRGERPLWDFPDGTLAGREVATYLLARAVGWTLVPPTVLRDGPLGPGMCQLWIDALPPDTLVDIVPSDAVADGWKPVLSGRDQAGRSMVVAHADDPRLRRMAVLDAVTNNADRKGGHLLATADGRLYGCDHGLCFHQENKLRTLLWGWAGEPLTEEATAVLERLVDDLGDPDAALTEALHEHLTRREVMATRRRAQRLRAAGRHPKPAGGWPSVPWPVF